MLRTLLACLALSACGSSSHDRLDASPTGDANDHGDGGGDPDGSVDASTTPGCLATEQCDGVVDDNCDGHVDEGCGRCALLEVACPTGCCPVDRWQVDAGTARGPSLAVADDGTIYFMYSAQLASGFLTPTLAIYDPTTGMWSTQAVAGAGYATYRNRVVLDAMNHLHVAYGPRDGGSLEYQRSDDGGHTFSPAVSPGVLDSSGLFDMAIDATGAPHIVYNADRPTSVFSELYYAHLVGTQWQQEALDPTTTSDEYPTIAIGFGNRPHIVTEAYEPMEPTVEYYTKRYMFWNGNRWIKENIDTIAQASGAQYSVSDSYFTAQSLHIDSDDAREVLFTKHDATGDHLILAHRGPADTDTWSQTTIAGVSGFTTPTLFVEDDGKRGAISDGLTLHREVSAGTWTSTPLAVEGAQVAYARRGHYLYIAYTNPAPTITVVDLAH